MQNISPFLWSILWNTIVAIWIITAIYITKILKDRLIKYLDYITALTVWLLLSIIFLWFIPEIVSDWFSWKIMWIYILVWIFLFYLLELFLHWHHCKDLWNHNNDIQHKHNTNWVLMFWTTILHNSFHWIVLFVAFSLNINFWIATTVALTLHAIPQNISNYIMNHKNIKYAYFAWLWGLIWALFTFPFANFLIEQKSYILAIISWWLLYTALADIFPEFKWKWTISKKIMYLIFIVLWILLFIFFQDLEIWINNNLHSIIQLKK